MRGKNNSKTNTTASAKMAKVIYQCTACKSKIRTTFEANLHPLIGTLVCRNCKDTYGNGDFAKNWDDGVDELGDDNYCRWCCDGGSLFGCMNVINEGISEERCHYAFCSDCITNNLPDDFILKSVENDKTENDENGHKSEKKLDEQSSDKSNGNFKENREWESEKTSEENLAEKKWLCYACDRTKLAHLRQYAIEAIQELSDREKKRTANNQGPPANQKKKRKTENSIPSSTANRAQRTAPKESNNLKDHSVSKELNLAETIFAPPGLMPRSRLQGANTLSKLDSDKSTNTSITNSSQTTKDAQVSKKLSQEQPPQSKNPQKATLTQAKDTIKVTEPENTPAKKMPTQGAPTTGRVTPSDKERALPTREEPVKALSDGNPLPLIKLSSTKEPVVAKQSTLAAAKAVAASLIAQVKPRPMSSSFTIVSKSQTTTKQQNTTINSSRVVGYQPQTNRDIMLTDRQESNQQLKKPEVVQPISEVEMKKRLQTYCTTKDTCIEEVNCRFTNLVQMLNSNDSKSKKVSDVLINEEINGLQKAMKEFDVMLLDLKKLSRSKIR